MCACISYFAIGTQLGCLFPEHPSPCRLAALTLLTPILRLLARPMTVFGDERGVPQAGHGRADRDAHP